MQATLRNTASYTSGAVYIMRFMETQRAKRLDPSVVFDADFQVRHINPMAILKIARMGHPVLRRVAEPVSAPDAPQIKALVSDMNATMIEYGGTGLAAPQVHVPLRVVLYFVSGTRAGPDESDVPLTVLINPELTPLSDDIAYDWEGCLSVPGLTGLVPRYTKIGLKAQNLDGKSFEREAEGFHARVLQHECDHLDGVLYPERMEDMSLLLFQDEMRHGVPPHAEALTARKDEG